MERDRVKALRNGNHRAFEDLFIAYFQRVKLFICGIIKSDADAEELAQDVFVRLWTNREAINIEKPSRCISLYHCQKQGFQLS